MRETAVGDEEKGGGTRLVLIADDLSFYLECFEKRDDLYEMTYILIRSLYLLY